MSTASLVKVLLSAVDNLTNSSPQYFQRLLPTPKQLPSTSMHTYLSLLLLSIALVTGCDARINDDEGGIGGTGIIAGTVTEVADLTVNGRSIDTTNAILLRNEVSQLSVETTTAVGEYVTLSTNEKFSDSGQIDAQRLEYRSPVTGPVTLEGDNNETMSVLGQHVIVDELAVLRGIENVAELSPGDVIEVSGFRTQDTITATAISRLDSSENPSEDRVHGAIDAVNTGNQTLVINDLEVDYSTAALIDLEADSLQVGLNIIVKGQAVNAGQLIANSVLLDSTGVTQPAGTRELFQGASTSGRQGRTVTVNNRPVLITDSTIFSDGIVEAAFSDIEGSSSSDIAVGDRVLVSAIADGLGNAIADRLTIVRQDNLIDLNGPIEDVSASLNRLVVNGIFVDLVATTLLIDSNSGVQTTLSIQDLAIGQSVEIKGNQTSPTRLLALRILRQN